MSLLFVSEALEESKVTHGEMEPVTPLHTALICCGKSALASRPA